ncbi:MAG TPA: 2-phospho-L-lactate guanylyltransferase [Streptosporangiaceae bacterium]|jgi:2-phospho-L-lactate guanylyltransferase|nr:2-phospho-L-lactate guanylyltransferase [Streptosporangiaceae bacterium]
MGTDAPLTWSVVIPVKLLALAKSRLSGLSDADRKAVALAMAADTVTAAVACPPVGDVIVVTDDPDVRTATGASGATVIADLPGAGLNEALTAGASYAAASWPGRGLAALTADLPALSAVELAVALAAASPVNEAFVADAAGSGTTLYTAMPGTAFRPRFGLRSRQRHREAGAVELEIPGIPGLRRDVDTLSDLCAAARIGLGIRTRAVRESIEVPCA